MSPVQPGFGRTMRQLREKVGKPLEQLSKETGISERTIGQVDGGTLEPTLSDAISIASNLYAQVQDLVRPRPARLARGTFEDPPPAFRMNQGMIRTAIEATYSVLDFIDDELQQRSETRLSQLIELANLSAVLGNVFGGILAKSSNGVWKRNSPHKYPDLIPVSRTATGGVEIKVALETNLPKGHLPKPGPHISVRYVLVDSENGYRYVKGTRGDAVAIWEVKCGRLGAGDFRLSNTPGDSGKTANFSADALRRMKLVYFDSDLCPRKDVDGYLKRNGFSPS
ncbi:MAG: helix-turn-helix transcriptional regulator [archaeon]|nr:MAG: helix-turn-helix transcriptional regulator [archaeon]